MLRLNSDDQSAVNMDYTVYKRRLQRCIKYTVHVSMYVCVL